MRTWRQYVVFEDQQNGIRLIEEQGPYGVWARLTENGPALEPVLAFERAMLQGRRRPTRLVNRDGTPTPRLREWRELGGGGGGE